LDASENLIDTFSLAGEQCRDQQEKEKPTRWTV
jgi:hypothetical protein